MDIFSAFTAGIISSLVAAFQYKKKVVKENNGRSRFLITDFNASFGFLAKPCITSLMTGTIAARDCPGASYACARAVCQASFTRVASR